MTSSAKAYRELVDRAKERALLDGAGCLLEWDERTYLPKKGGAHRADQIALIAGILHDQATDPAIDGLLSEVEGSPLVEDPVSVEAVNVREWRRQFDRESRLAKSLVEAMTRASTVAQQRWEEAKDKSDFRILRAALEEVVRLQKEVARARPVGDVLYDTLLDDHEPGATVAELNVIFRVLQDELIVLREVIQSSGRLPDTTIMTRHYPIPAQERFGRMAAETIGFDFDRGRLDVVAHPFCLGVGPDDKRLTTTYDPNQFSDAFFATIHEAGHGIYDQGLDTDHYGTPMGDNVSFGIHESQSRMWENFIGRSAAFWRFFFPKARDAFPTALTDVTEDAFVFALNDVRPSFTRLEADEATYNLQILMRFELEQALISGDLSVRDLPGAWNDRFEASFGLRPPNDAVGCLQDIHWSASLIGYFPTYTLGNLYAAQFFEQARADLGPLDEQFERGDFSPIRAWSIDRIHRHGKRYRAGELVMEVTGKPLSHKPLVDYLWDKLGRLYGVDRTKGN